MVGIEFERSVGPKGQVVIPQEIRKATGIGLRSRVLIMLEDHRIIIEAETVSVAEQLRTMAKKQGKVIEKLDMNKLHEEEIEERWKAAKRGHGE